MRSSFPICFLLVLLNIAVQCWATHRASTVKNVEIPYSLTVRTQNLIREQGYPVETHEVQTEDGYILEMHRIPHGLVERENDAGNKPAVYLAHSFLCSSAEWLLNSPDNVNAYLLADSGFDVWMGNYRGNIYSRKHAWLDPKDTKFWEFSIDEKAKYDNPAMIDYVLEKTKQEKLFYVGLSIGASKFFAMMHHYPQYNDKIFGMVCIAPALSSTFESGPIKKLKRHASKIEKFLKNAGQYVWPPSIPIVDDISWACSRKWIPTSLCIRIVAKLIEADSSTFHPDYKLKILQSLSPGDSINTQLHLMQIGLERKFQHYDHGRSGNLARYGTTRPPEYDITGITVPILAFFSRNDLITPPANVGLIVNKLPNVTRVHEVKDFFHADFLWSARLGQRVYKFAVRWMKSVMEA